MESHDIIIRGVHAQFGDARLTVYKIYQEVSDTDALPLRHSHFYYEIHRITSGEGTFWVSGQPQQVHEGEVFILPPHAEHCPLAGDAQEQVLALILEETDGEDGYFTYFHRTLQTCSAVPIALPPSLQQCFGDIFRRFEGSSFRDRFIQQAEVYRLIHAFFDRINHLQASPAPSARARQEAENDLTLEFLLNDFSSSLPEIAQRLGYSPRHTARLIRRKYGQSLGEIRQKSMIATAKDLLRRKPPLTLQTVAMQSGFLDAKAMNRAFIRWEGVSPGTYRSAENP